MCQSSFQRRHIDQWKHERGLYLNIYKEVTAIHGSSIKQIILPGFQRILDTIISSLKKPAN